MEDSLDIDVRLQRCEDRWQIVFVVNDVEMVITLPEVVIAQTQAIVEALLSEEASTMIRITMAEAMTPEWEKVAERAQWN